MNPVDFVEQAQQEFFEQVAYYEEREKGLLLYIDQHPFSNLLHG